MFDNSMESIIEPVDFGRLLLAAREWGGGDGIFKCRPGISLYINMPSQIPLINLGDVLGLSQTELNLAETPHGHGNTLLLRLAFLEELLRATWRRVGSRKAGSYPLSSLPTIRLKLGEAWESLNVIRALAEVGASEDAGFIRDILTQTEEILVEIHGGSSALIGSVGDILRFEIILGSEGRNNL